VTDIRQFRRLARNWEAFGRVDPFFGVLSDPTKFGGKWDPQEFFETGHAHVRKLLRILRERDVSFVPGTCLDFGCGVGRLTIPLSAHFDRTIGVDVAKAMIGPARRHLKPGDRCEFVVNRRPDLRCFDTAAFDVVHSCLVLQHMPPDVAHRYIGEFFRVARPGGLVVFQLPAVRLQEHEINAAHALPESGYVADIHVAGLPEMVSAGESVTVQVAVTNRSNVVWPHDIPGGRHISIANHWLNSDGSIAASDDGRAYLSATLAPGGVEEVLLTVRAPSAPGAYLLEVDLVQERICWFAEKGSQTARIAVTVVPSSSPLRAPDPAADPTRVSIVERIRRRLRRGTPTFDMYVVPREDVEQTVRTHGGMVLHAIDDNAAGERWISYTYVCRRA
jgi:SAM-dependent methyltransferase